VKEEVLPHKERVLNAGTGMEQESTGTDTSVVSGRLKEQMLVKEKPLNTDGTRLEHKRHRTRTQPE
jgi:hypothetical protein